MHRTWALLGRLRLETRPKLASDWNAVHALVRVAKPYLISAASRLRDALAASRCRLAPLQDPFDVDLGVHRWLADDREESYSDWLQWVVEHLQVPALVF